MFTAGSVKLPVLNAAVSTECCAPPRRRLKGAETAVFGSLLRALSDETRLRIVALLASAKGSVCVCDIEARFDLAQPTISHHLKVLRQADLVTTEKRGTWVYYEVNRPRIDELLNLHELLHP